MRSCRITVVAALLALTCAPFAMAAVPTAPRMLPAGPSAQTASPGGNGSEASEGAVAVLPFVNISQDAADDWLGDGIVETVVADLEAQHGLTVIAQERVRAALAGRSARSAQLTTIDDASVIPLGRELGARWVVTGGFQHQGGQLRITARMVDVSTGVVAKTVKVDGVFDEIFALQDQIAAALSTDGGSSTLTRAAPSAAGRPGSVASAGEGAETVAPDALDNAGELQPDQVTGGIVLPDADPANLAGGGGGRGGQGGPGGLGGRGGGAGQSGAPSAAPGGVAAAGILSGRPSLTAVRAVEPPRIDGQLDDAVWQRAARLTEFVQVRPLDGAPATEDTEVWVAYDSGTLYFAMHAHYSDPSVVRPK